MKRKRIISGIVLFTILALILILENTTAVNIAISTVAIISINEYFNSFKEKKNVDRWIGTLLAILIAFLNLISPQMLIVSFFIGIVFLFLKIIITKMETNFEDVAITGFGIVYILAFIIFIPLLYKCENGKFLIWYLAIAAWGTDTFAYAVGMKLGKHKLTPISPKKSVEGSIAGIIGAVILSIIYTYILNKVWNFEISYIAIVGIATILSVLGQIGDLAASSVKRFTGIKDFGKIIPGHGGMLDRIDSILLIAPFAYFLLNLI